jgi:hypothetical protein
MKSFTLVAALNGATVTARAIGSLDSPAAIAVNISGLLEKRVTISPNCGDRQQLITTAIQECASHARAGAAEAAKGGSPLIEKFFKNPAASGRVANLMEQIAEECGTPGLVSATCQEEIQPCGEMSAWAEKTGSLVQLCPAFFRAPTRSQCGETRLSMGEIMLHELTHSKARTADHVYGLERAMALGAQQAIENADNYAYFARAAATSCIDSGGAAGPGGPGGPPGGPPDVLRVTSVEPNPPALGITGSQAETEFLRTPIQSSPSFGNSWSTGHPGIIPPESMGEFRRPVSFNGGSNVVNGYHVGDFGGGGDAEFP